MEIIGSGSCCSLPFLKEKITMEKHILIVGSNPGILEGLVKVLGKSNFIVWSAKNTEEGLKILEMRDILFVILDFKTSVNVGLISLKKFKKIYPDVPVMVLTVYKDTFTKDLALTMGANAYFSKPFEIDDLVNTINQLIKNNQSKKSFYSEKTILP